MTSTKRKSGTMLEYEEKGGRQKKKHPSKRFRSKRWAFMAPILAISLLFIPSLIAAPIVIVDQQNLTSNGTPGDGTNHSFGQSFVPNLAGVDAFEFDLRIVLGSPVTGVVYLRAGLSGTDGLGGAILGTSLPVTISGSIVQTYHFDFPATIALIPGNTYVGHFEGNVSASVMGFRANDTLGGAPDAYSSGQFLSSGISHSSSAVTRFDMVFTEGRSADVASVPEPAVDGSGIVWSSVRPPVAAQMIYLSRRCRGSGLYFVLGPCYGGIL